MEANQIQQSNPENGDAGQNLKLTDEAKDVSISQSLTIYTETS
jgi:hypothetical protein